MDSPKPLRIGIIGAGANTVTRHIPGFQQIENVTITTVCNRSEESSQRVADEFGIERISRNWKDVVSADDVDAVLIGTWPYLHAEASIAALDAGKHVLTEARMARNVSEAQAMLEASKRNPGLVSQIVAAPMSFDFDETVIGLLESGVIGDLREVCVTHTGAQYADSMAAHGWRQDSELSGYNIISMGIYYEIILRWLKKEPAKVFASGAVFTKERLADGGSRKVQIEIPESISMVALYPDESRLVGHFSGIENGTPRNEIRLNGSKGSLRLDFGNEILWKRQNFSTGGMLWRSSVGSPDEIEVAIAEGARRGWQVEADFVKSIREGLPVELTSFEDGLRYMRFTEAVYLSSKEGGCWKPLT